MTVQELPQTIRARELLGDFWFNSEPVPLSALRGQVILLYFWDFASAAALRMLSYVREWHRRYASYGVVIVGVHTPRYPFAKQLDRVQKAIARLAIQFPVVIDNETLIAMNYECRTLPEVVLIDKDGFVRYRGIGEGNPTALERAIQALLYHAGIGGVLPVIMDPLRDVDRADAVCFRATPEVLAGYLRGSLGNVEGSPPESVVHYADPGLYLDGRFYVEGDWRSERDCLRLVEGAEPEGHVIVGYQGLDVQGILEPEGEKSVEVTVRQDNAFLSANRGDDVRIDGQGRSFVLVEEPRLYSLVKNREFGEHVLKLSSATQRFALYSFSFSTAVIPELVSNN